MTLPQQAHIVLRCLELARLPTEAAIRWADNAIAAQSVPPAWLYDLSAIDPCRFADVLSLLQQHARAHLPQEVDVCILAHLLQRGSMTTQAACARAFAACFADCDQRRHPRTPPFEKLADLLCELDQLDPAGPDDGDCRRRLTQALAECQRASGELPRFISELYAA